MRRKGQMNESFGTVLSTRSEALFGSRTENWYASRNGGMAGHAPKETKRSERKNSRCHVIDVHSNKPPLVDLKSNGGKKRKRKQATGSAEIEASRLIPTSPGRKKVTPGFFRLPLRGEPLFLPGG